MADDTVLSIAEITAKIAKTLKPEDPFNQSV